MFDVGLYLTFIASVLFLLLTPGPVIALITSTAVRKGKLCAFKTAIGTNLASLILISIATLAICGFISINKYLIYIIGIMGASYISYTSLVHLKNIIKETSGYLQNKGGYGFKHGFIIAISNPKDIFFFMSFFPQFTNIITDSLKLSLIVLCLSWVVLDLSILFIYIILVHQISSDRNSKILDFIATLFLLLIGLVAFVYNAQMIKETINIFA
ncbi:TPA: LysE family translocator [Escherichia coli]